MLTFKQNYGQLKCVCTQLILEINVGRIDFLGMLPVGDDAQNFFDAWM